MIFTQQNQILQLNAAALALDILNIVYSPDVHVSLTTQIAEFICVKLTTLSLPGKINEGGCGNFNPHLTFKFLPDSVL
jgi:hypothetical protein